MKPRSPPVSAVPSPSLQPHRAHDHQHRSKRKEMTALSRQIEDDIRQIIVALSESIRFGDAAPRIFTAAMVYLRRISSAGACDHFVVDEKNYKRLCTVAIMMATKLYIEEHVKVNIKFATATNIPLLELNALEIEFLHLVDFQLLIDHTDFQNMFEWIEAVARQRGFPFRQSPSSASSASLGTPHAHRRGSNVNRSFAGVSPMMEYLCLSPSTQPASDPHSKAAMTPPSNGLNGSLSTYPNGSFSSPKLFKSKYVVDDASPIPSPRGRDRSGAQFPDESPDELPSLPSSGDSCSFFQKPKKPKAPARCQEALEFSPPPAPGGDSSSDDGRGGRPMRPMSRLLMPGDLFHSPLRMEAIAGSSMNQSTSKYCGNGNGNDNGLDLESTKTFSPSAKPTIPLSALMDDDDDDDRGAPLFAIHPTFDDDMEDNLPRPPRASMHDACPFS